MDEYLVRLDTFCGPLDLLLYLVKRNEVDVVDLPIAPITEQFRHFLDLIQLIDMERAGDFVVMLGTLMEIKSKMVLPRPEAETEDEADDPRLELVKQLLEYKKFKDAAVLLDAQAERQAHRMARLPVPEPKVVPDPSRQPLQEVEIWDLVSAFGRLMRETMSAQPQAIIVDNTPIDVYMEGIVTRLRAEGALLLRDLFTPPYQRSRLIGLFLATLELMKGRQVIAEQVHPLAEIRLTLSAEASSPVTPLALAETSPENKDTPPPGTLLNVEISPDTPTHGIILPSGKEQERLAA